MTASYSPESNAGCATILGVIDFLILGSAGLLTLWASWPPRGERRRWLLVGLVVLWVAFLLVGWRRGIQPGFGAWLIALAFIGALLGLLVLWSVSNLLARPHRNTGEERSKSAGENNQSQYLDG